MDSDRASIERELACARQVERRGHAQPRYGAPREQNADSATDRRESGALDSQLPRHLPSARAEREADREFAAARRSSHGSEVREVYTRDEEDERDGTAQTKDSRAHVADDLGLKRSDVHTDPVPLILRKLLGDPRLHRG